MNRDEIRELSNRIHAERPHSGTHLEAALALRDYAALKAKVEQVREYLGAVQQPNWSVVRGAIAILDAPPEEATE